MKIDSIAWEKNIYREFLVMWPMIVPSVMSLLVTTEMIETAPVATFSLPFLALIVWVPFVVVEVRRHRAEAAQEKRELQEKYDAEDRAMFGKPLREVEL